MKEIDGWAAKESLIDDWLGLLLFERSGLRAPPMQTSQSINQFFCFFKEEKASSAVCLCGPLSLSAIHWWKRRGSEEKTNKRPPKASHAAASHSATIQFHWPALRHWNWLNCWNGRVWAAGRAINFFLLPFSCSNKNHFYLNCWNGEERGPCSAAINQNIFELIAGGAAGEEKKWKQINNPHSLKRMLVDCFHFSSFSCLCLPSFILSLLIEKKKGWFVCWWAAAFNPLSSSKRNQPNQPNQRRRAAAGYYEE